MSKELWLEIDRITKVMMVNARKGMLELYRLIETRRDDAVLWFTYGDQTAIGNLDLMRQYFEESEDWDKCILIRDIIKEVNEARAVRGHS